ncbi:MAG: hypothetical protein ACP5NY_06960 [Thermocladium sp.]
MCALSSPIEVPMGANGESINIAIPIAPSSNSEYMLSARGVSVATPAWNNTSHLRWHSEH